MLFYQIIHFNVAQYNCTLQCCSDQTVNSKMLLLLPLPLLRLRAIGSLHSRRTRIDMSSVWIWTPQQALSPDDGHQAPVSR